MKKLVIAEKPSVGRELARNLRCFQREKGYTEGQDYIVTWALGHLVELAEPQHYSDSYRRWSLKDLPMLPETLDQVVIEESKDQFDVIAGLLKRPDVASVVIATDAGREGELVARWILKLAGYDGKAERLWISSQTEKAILEGFSSLRPASDYDNLYKAAECRAAADWYVGMNVTRALTCYHDARITSGRVQTPTLALMSAREEEIEAFEGRYYYSARADFGTFFASYYPEENTVRFQDEALSEELRAWSGKEGRVVEMKTEEKTEPVPLAYDLTELQRDANISLGFSAKETLDTLQRLYEVHKIVTYPRTDSRCITEDIVATLRDRVKAISGTIFSRQADQYLEYGFKSDNPRFVNNALVSDHHAIIPTEERADTSKLSPSELKLWQLIALRFLEVLGEDYIYRTTTCTVEVEGKRFKTRLTLPVQKGYRGVSESAGLKSPVPAVDEGDGSYVLCSMKEGDKVTLNSVKVRKSVTNPPERYTDATLLSAMEHAGRFVEKDELKANLGNGLGTPATRADIIEKLVQNRYVERDGKYFVPTAKGREVVRLAPEMLRSPELTGVWEGRLERISRGKEDPDQFIKDIKKLSTELVDEVKKSGKTFAPDFKDTKKCPWCGTDMMKAKDEDGSVHYICQKLSCQYEEKEVRVKIETGISSAPKKLQQAPGDKVKVVLNRKSAVKVPKAVYETKTVVVKESKKAYKRDRRQDDRARQAPSRHTSSDYGGGTMADFFRLSKERQETKGKKRK